MSITDHSKHKWPTVPLGRVAREKSVRAAGMDQLPVLSMSKHRGFVPSIEYFKKRVFSRDISNYKVVHEGQFAYATIHLDEGSVDYLRHHTSGLISPMYTVFETDERLIDSNYLLALLKSPYMISKFMQVGQGSVNRRKSVDFNSLAKTELPLPPLNIQQQIAAILDAADAAVRASAELMAQLETFKRGAMQELLLRGLPGRHERFQQTEVGEIPEGWEVRELNSLGHIQAGRQRSPHHINGSPRPYLRVANVFDGRIETADVFSMPFTDQEFRRYKLQIGDILLNEGQSLELVGRPAMYMGDPQECCFQNTLVRFSPNSEIDGHYALKLFQHFLYSGRFMAIAKRTTSIAHLGVSRFAGLRVALPPLPEQCEIVSILSTFDRRIQVERARGKQLEQVKRGLVQGLLSGDLLVDVPEEVAAP